MSSDGHIISYKHRLLEEAFINYYAYYFGQPDEFNITYEVPNSDKLKTVAVAALNIKEISQIYRERYAQTDDNNRLNQAFLSHKHLADNQIAYINIATFDTKTLKEQGQNYEKFLAQSFEQINANNQQHLIIDLRNNNGGDADISLLMRYLSSQKFHYLTSATVNTNKRLSFLPYTNLPKNYKITNITKNDDGQFVIKNKQLVNSDGYEPQSQNLFKGKVYMLINGLTNGSAAQLASIAKHNKLATIIGEEAGSTYAHTNINTCLFTLPHTEIRLYLPLIKATLAVDNQAFPNRGLIPDFELLPTIDNVLEGRDTILEFVTNMIEIMPD